MAYKAGSTGKACIADRVGGKARQNRQAGWEGEEGQDMRGRAFLQDESQQGSAGSQGETGHKGAGSEGRAGWQSETGKSRVEMQGRETEPANVGWGWAGEYSKADQGRKETWGSQSRTRQERKLRQGSAGGQVRAGRAS